MCLTNLRRSGFARLTLGLLFLAGLAGLYGQLTSTINRNEAQAIEKIAEFVSAGQGDAIDAQLNQIGFHPPSNIPEGEWRNFPTVRKLDTAFLMAEQNAPKQGGGRMLALLSQSLAQQYQPLR